MASIVSHDIPDALGDPENPLSTEQVCGKARMLLDQRELFADRGGRRDLSGRWLSRTAALSPT